MSSATSCVSLSLLYRQHRQELIRHLYKIVQCEYTAEDLMQETTLRIAGLDSERSLEQPRAFLYRTATNLALDYLRRQKVRDCLDLSESVSETLSDHGPSLENEVFDMQRFEIFMGALESLPPRCRQVFILHRVHHRSYTEIARRLGISQSAVEKHIIRALIKCKDFINEYGAEPW